MTTFSGSKWWQVMEKKAEKSTSIPAEFCRLMRGLHSAPASSGTHILHIWTRVIQAAQSLGTEFSLEYGKNVQTH